MAFPNIFRRCFLLLASVIIPCRNAAPTLGDCLSALLTQDIGKEQFEIIVVNDGSTDNTVGVAESCGVSVFSIPPKGPAAARNYGARKAISPIILFTDADCIPAKDWVSKMLKPFQESGVSGVKGIYRTDQTKLVARFVQAEYESKYEYMRTQETIDFIDTYSAGFRRDIFLALGGYDESFPGASVEDQEFSFRMHEAGYIMVFNPEAVVTHRHADTLRWYFRKKFNIGYWKVKVLRLHPGKIVKDSHTPVGLKLQIPLAFMFCVFLLFSPLIGIAPLIFTSLIFIFSGAGELRQCMKKKEPLLVVAAPFILFTRSIALGSGLLAGFFDRKSM